MNKLFKNKYIVIFPTNNSIAETVAAYSAKAAARIVSHSNVVKDNKVFPGTKINSVIVRNIRNKKWKYYLTTTNRNKPTICCNNCGWLQDLYFYDGKYYCRSCLARKLKIDLPLGKSNKYVDKWFVNRVKENGAEYVGEVNKNKGGNK